MKRKEKVSKPPSLFPSEQDEGGMYGGLDKAIKNIREVAFPRLAELGFTANFIKGTKVSEKLKLNEFKKWSTLEKRLLSDGAGLLCHVFPGTDVISMLIFQIFVIDSTESDDLQNLPRFNIPTDLIRKAEKENLDLKHLVYSELCHLNIHFLILTRPKDGMFWMGKFSDYPEDYYELTYRKHKEKLDRMCMKTKYQKTHFHSIIMFLKNNLLKIFQK